MSLVFLFPRPKSLPRRVRHHTTRPDADNCAKAVKDALRGVVYRDDSQIVELFVSKGYDMAPGAIITVTRIVDQPPLIQNTPGPARVGCGDAW
jgi:Holliday junction resolvase RusA-like endonuclease